MTLLAKYFFAAEKLILALTDLQKVNPLRLRRYEAASLWRMRNISPTVSFLGCGPIENADVVAQSQTAVALWVCGSGNTRGIVWNGSGWLRLQGHHQVLNS